MMSRIYFWIAAALAAVAGIFAYGKRKESQGKSEGHSESKAEQQKKVIEHVEKSKQSETASASKPVDARIERMRQRARGHK